MFLKMISIVNLFAHLLLFYTQINNSYTQTDTQISNSNLTANDNVFIDEIPTNFNNFDILRQSLSSNTILSSLGYLMIDIATKYFPSVFQEDTHTLRHLTTFQREIFTQHNVYRAQGGVPFLEWDNDLTNYIKNYIIEKSKFDNCEFEHSPSVDRDKVGKFQNIGENLYMSWGFTPNGYRVVNKWFEEIDCYRYSTISSSCSYWDGPNCKMAQIMVGHFTQLMWQDATHIGCDIEECKRCIGQSCPRIYVGCVYGSTTQSYGGNVVGWYPFDTFTAKKFNIPSCISRTTDDNSITYMRSTFSSYPDVYIDKI